MLSLDRLEIPCKVKLASHPSNTVIIFCRFQWEETTEGRTSYFGMLCLQTVQFRKFNQSSQRKLCPLMSD